MATYDRIIKQIREVVKYDMTCIDIGAERGELAMLMAGLVGDHSGYVYAYEPDASNCRTISYQTVLADRSNVIVCNQAVTDKMGPCMLTSEHIVTTLIGEEAKCAWVAAITSTALDDIMDTVGKIDVVVIHPKVDGKAVRRGAKRLITEYNPIFLEV